MQTNTQQMTATEIPPAAVEAAAEAILDYAESPFMEIDNTRKLAVAALEAAWPIIAADIKAEIVRRLQLERGEHRPGINISERIADRNALDTQPQRNEYSLAINAAIGVVQACFAQRSDPGIELDWPSGSAYEALEEIAAARLKALAEERAEIERLRRLANRRLVKLTAYRQKVRDALQRLRQQVVGDSDSYYFDAVLAELGLAKEATDANR